MGVDFNLCRCRGVVVSEEVMDKIKEALEDEFDEFYDNCCQPIDAWSGGDVFIGATSEVGCYNDSFVIPFEDFSFPVPVRVNWVVNFKKIYETYHLERFFEWKPKDYLINFCY